MRSYQRIIISFVGLLIATSSRGVGAAELTISLAAYSDPTSVFYEYNSDAFARMNLREPPPNQSKQRFHQISNPAVVFGGLDLFPNDEQFRFGELRYDSSALTNGYGTAPLTGITLGITANPFDSTYLNWARFTGTTHVVGPLTGTVTVYNNVPVAVDLTAQVQLVFSSILGSTMPGVYDGTFAISGNRFEVEVAGNPTLDTVFGNQAVSLEWLFSGEINALPTLGDTNGDDWVDVADYTVWADNFLITTAQGAADGDFNLDGLVDISDYTIWADRFRPQLALAATAVPEPATLVLLAGGLPLIAGLAIRRRR